jgi:hypothetical protein
MGLRSRGTIVGIFLATCALALLGVAMAAGGTASKQQPRLRGAVAAPISQHGLLSANGHRAHRASHAKALGRQRSIASAKPSLARARAAAREGRPLAVAVAVEASRSRTKATAPLPAARPLDGEAAASAPASPPAARPGPAAAVPSALYWGASIGSQLTGVQAPWDMGAVTRFEQIAGKQVSLVNFFSPFANCAAECSFYKFPTGPMERIREYGAIPVLSWSSQSIPSSLEEPDFQLADVVAGTYDVYIREFAEAAHAWGRPFFLRFNWEMNGRWFPWSEGVNGNQPGEFVAAWRHVHDIFASAGADNVTWVWCPNVDPDGIFADLGSLYPGDKYVDWTGLDGYNWGLNPANPDRWRSFNDLYSTTYQRIVGSVAPEKPLLIGEMGSTEQGGSKASWIDEALTEIPIYYPEIRGLLWFDTYDSGMDWPIETSASSAGAFAQAIQSPAYVTEGDTESSEGPIPPPE